MITTITLNAAIDKTYFVPNFQEDSLNRVESMFAEPGGKGINVAKVLHTLGVPVIASGIVGGYNGKQIGSKLDDVGLDHHFIRVDGESRLCLNIIDQKTGSQTEILESGPVIGEQDWEATKDKVMQLAAQSEYVIFSGSLPKGLADDSYAELIHMIKDCPTRVILDTSGPALQYALKALPYMIKPNKDELANLLGKEDISEAEVIETLREWRDFGISLIVVTLGSDGALALVEGAIYKIEAPKISAVNPVGSGDAFTAGMTAGLAEKMDVIEMLRLATAAGTANALENKAGHITLKNIEDLKTKIKVEII